MELQEQDSQLIALAKSGDAAARAHVVESLRPIIHFLIRQLHIRPHDREDARQECLITVLVCLKLHRTGPFRRYASKAIRRRLWEFTGERHDLQLDPAYDCPYESSEATLIVADLLATAPHPELLIPYFGLRGQGEQSVNQIAAQVGLSPKTVQRGITESLDHLRNQN